jgi:phosphoribosylamine--glycine ligase/phosphoribosylaminoimidazole synthetase
MKIAVVGSGGREQALAWALRRSPRRPEVIVGDADEAFAADLAVIGPETELAAGLVDRLTAAGVRAFGPTRSAAQLEWSKSYARTFCDRHGIAGARYRRVTDATEGNAWIDSVPFDVVVKADGLAAGKGVVVASSKDQAKQALARLLADGPVVLEERLEGEEVSCLALTDGRTVVALPPAQDHKRIGEGDRGPNTGGMGVYAPAPVCDDATHRWITEHVLQRAVDGSAADGRRFVGVLYAGMMLTASGPRLLEFNCRWGDPETQAIVPLLDCDLVEVFEACLDARLASVPVRIRPGASCAVVLAAAGYPVTTQTGDEVAGIEAAEATGALVFPAGLRRDGDGTWRTGGGRVLAVVGVAEAFASARQQAYAAAGLIQFRGRQMRRDIGWRAVARSAAAGGYAAAGVDIDAGLDAVERMKGAVAATHTAEVLAGVGSFGGVIDAKRLLGLREPVVVGSTDGVGTKVALAAEAGRVGGVGTDLVNHCINDVLVQNARPWFFMDYIAASRLDPASVAEVVSAMAEACAAAGCVLLGGETAEMPGVYHHGHLDVAGTLVGIADRSRLLPRPSVAPGDVLVGLASNGAHTNGYSLLRRVFAGIPLDASPEPLDGSLADALLAPHRSYLPALGAVLDDEHHPIKALVHVTGGGLIDNPGRVLPDGCGIRIDVGAWPVPPLFRLVRDVTGLSAYELHRTLNMGIGMVAIVSPGDVDALQGALSEASWAIGEVVAGSREVHLA